MINYLTRPIRLAAEGILQAARNVQNPHFLVDNITAGIFVASVVSEKILQTARNIRNPHPLFFPIIGGTCAVICAANSTGFQTALSYLDAQVISKFDVPPLVVKSVAVVSIGIAAASLVKTAIKIHQWFSMRRTLNNIMNRLNIPLNERATLAADAQILIGPNTSEFGMESILSILQRVRQGEARTALIRDALPLIGPNMAVLEVANILDILRNIPLQGEERTTLIRDALPLIGPNMPGLEVANILDILQNIPLQGEARTTLIRDALPLIQPHMRGSTIALILNTVRAVPLQGEARTTLIRDALPLIRLNTGEFAIESILGIVQEIPLQGEARTALIRDALPLIGPNMAGFDLETILNALRRGTLDEDRTALIRDAELLTRPNMNGISIEHVLNALRAIPQGEARTALVREAEPFIRPNMHGIDIERILYTLRHIPRQGNERRALIIAAQLDIGPNMTTYEIERILSALQHPPQDDERIALIREALPLIPPNMKSVDIRRILNALREIPQGEARTALIRETLPLILLFPRIGDEILQTIHQTPVDQRAVLVRRTLERVILHEEAGMLENIREDSNPFDLPEELPEELDVHNGNRDQRTRAALVLLWQQREALDIREQGRLVREFIQTLETPSRQARLGAALNTARALRDDALWVLQGANQNNDYGPLLKDQGFAFEGFPLTGQELIARLFAFANSLQEPDRSNVISGMARALQKSITRIDPVTQQPVRQRVCDQGKTQQLVIAALQGYLPGVQIDVETLTTPQAMEVFFSDQERGAMRQAIDSKAALIQEARRFLDGNLRVRPLAFLIDLNRYADAEDLAP